MKLDLSELKENDDIDSMRKGFDEILQIAFEKVGFVQESGSARSCLGQIKAWLDRQEPGSLVLLVDEYDAPLNGHLDDPVFFDRIRSLLSGFFLRVKSADRVWRFVLVTGVAKFNKASVFSAFNNLKDISLDPAYGTLLGYTEDEIMENFGPFVENAARTNGMDVPTLMDAMRAQYDGFCFDEAAETRVYAPWSVLSFLDAPRRGLRNFWYGSAGQSSMVLNYVRTHPLTDDVERFGEEIPVDMDRLRDSNDAETLRPEVFLFQAGYLTIRRTDPDTAWLGFPNGEVTHAMSRLMAERMLRSGDIAVTDLDSWRRSVKGGDVAGLVAAMNGTFGMIDYEGYPLTRESHVRAAAQVYLMALGFGVTVERHDAKGRSDLELDAGGFHWVLEFKHARKGDDPKRLLAKALVQVRDSRYGESSCGGRKLLRVGLVFDGEGRRFVGYGVA